MSLNAGLSRYFGAALLIGGGLAHGPAVVAQSAQPSPQILAGEGIAMVQTDNGTVQGFVEDGISTFRGIPYATAERFLPAVKAAPWAGTKQVLAYGNVCPQPINPDYQQRQAFLSDWVFWPQTENCLNLNVWTPAADDKKRPVMVWLHGGGYSSGSSIELPYYDGANLSRKGDVIVVSVNHRLNILGHLDLSAYGEQYRSSGNVGISDIVTALEWVRDNAEAFGGDPDNVTIFGQSGGGGKVTTLLSAPAAAGMFDKAIIMSGASTSPANRAADQSRSRRVAELVFKHAGLENGDVEGLSRLPYEQLQAAGAKALQEANQLGAGGRVGWGPVYDHAFLPALPFDGEAPAFSADVPLLIGSALSEFQLANPELTGRTKWSDAQAEEYARTTYRDSADAVIAAFRQAYPELPMSEIGAIDSGTRAGSLTVATLKAEQPAPVYNYLFAWRSPILDYGWSASHTVDVPFYFNNAALGVQATGGGPEVDRLTQIISEAWINFAHTGNPSTDSLPEWSAFKIDRPATMIFDTKPRLEVGHDAELIKLLSAQNATPNDSRKPG
jgi:para-nitrobenzyl esterase